MSKPPNFRMNSPVILTQMNLIHQAEKLFTEAFALHQQGQLLRAQSIYEQVLKIKPNHFDAMNLLGVIAAQNKKPALAVQLIGRAITIDASNATAHYNLGLALHELNQLKEALNSYERAIEIKPDYYYAHNNKGNALRDLKRLEEALVSYNLAIQFKSDYVEAYFNRSNVLLELKRLDEALVSYKHTIQLNPDFAEAYFSYGIVLLELKKFDEAVVSFELAIKLRSDYAEAYSNLGLAYQALNRMEEALASYTYALEIEPNLDKAHNNKGNALKVLNKIDEALASYERAIKINPKFVEAYLNHGNLHLELKHWELALESYERAIEVDSGNAEVYLNKGLALQKLKRVQEALTSFNRAVEINPELAEAHSNRGLVLQELNRLDEALVSYDLAIKLKPNFAEAHSNRGNALRESNYLDDALVSFDRAILINPNLAQAHSNRGVVMEYLKRFQDALDCYNRAIELMPDYAEAFSNRGNTLKELKRLDDARDSYEKALVLKPNYEFLLGTLIHTNHQMCEWNRYDENNLQLRVKLENKEKVSPSFPILAIYDSPSLQRVAAEIWVEAKCPPNHALGPINKATPKTKIRLGYFSSDFIDHPVSFLAAELFELHDRSAFEVIGFSFTSAPTDVMQDRLKKGFDKFIDVSLLSNIEVSKLARELAIDIAIDLGGHTLNARTEIFAFRAAPIQVSYIGYLGTMGANYFDYLIADETIIPKNNHPYYCEKIAYLPSYQVNDRKRIISGRAFTKSELGIPEENFLFCCFNNNYKITPGVFESWIRILKAVDKSTLLLLAENSWSEFNLTKEAELRGIDKSRLTFAKRIPRSDYLARYRLADLFLDTMPYNAGTTASDALWAGLPVLTQIGQSFAGRVAASLLNAIELPELITHTQAEYESKAIELACNPVLMSEIKSKLAANRLTAQLFNTPLFTKHIEKAYSAMVERNRANLPPEHIYIDT